MALTLPSECDINTALSSDNISVHLKRIIKQADDAMNHAFLKQTDIVALVKHRASVMDVILCQCWIHFFSGTRQIGLCAVGGFGRGELHLYSDIDVMIIADHDALSSNQTKIEEFITLLWDLGLEIGHSVRTLEDVKQESSKDITVATNIMEARLLAGEYDLFQALQTYTLSHQDWSLADFVSAKFKEQESRYQKFDDDAYRVEPNVKDGPGGLRDLQNIGWVAKRYYGPQKTLFELDFLTDLEKQQLKTSKDFLWKIRWGLHYVSGRNENRLMFDLQKRLAVLFNYCEENAENNSGVEAFMQDYHQAVIMLERLNEMLMQLLKETFFNAHETPVTPINERFNIRNNYLEVNSAEVFQQNPNALLEVFKLMQEHPNLAGVGAQTIRAIRQHRNLIDDNFRADQNNQDLFIHLLCQPIGVTREFRRMNRYGIMARYLPVFQHLVGLMQFDLFHIYTVDQHTLAVLGQTRRYVTPEGCQAYPKAAEVFNQLDNPLLLYIAAIFHDMGKGCGGDHSVVGEKMVDEFCRTHRLKKSDRKLCMWLVRHHLIMSYTSQRKDITDPEEIQEFAKLVGDQRHLNYLFLLTIADINGTNPSLWTSWRQSLLEELYNRTSRALRRGPTNPLYADEIKQERQERASELLEYSNLNQHDINRFWHTLPDEYFLRHSSDEVAWQTSAILSAGENSLPLIDIKNSTKRGGTAILIYSNDQSNLFAQTAITLDKLMLNVVDARIITTKEKKSIDTFIVLDHQNEPELDNEKKSLIIRKLKESLNDSGPIKPSKQSYIPRQLKALSIPTQIMASSAQDNQHTVIEVTTTDRPGILAQIGQAFLECNISTINAKINTLGERVDDVFFITDETGGAIQSAERLTELIDTLYEKLDG